MVVNSDWSFPEFLGLVFSRFRTGLFPISDWSFPENLRNLNPKSEVSPSSNLDQTCLSKYVEDRNSVGFSPWGAEVRDGEKWFFVKKYNIGILY